MIQKKIIEIQKNPIKKKKSGKPDEKLVNRKEKAYPEFQTGKPEDFPTLLYLSYFEIKIN